MIHRSDQYLDDNLWAHPGSALDQMADCSSPLEQLVAIDSALYRGFILHRDLRDFVCGTARRRRWLRFHASASAESPLETVARVVLVEAGFPVTQQGFIEGVGRADLQLEDGSVVETDGFDSHSSRLAFVEDRRKGRVIQRQDRRLLRYASEDVLGNPKSIAYDAAQLLGRPVSVGFEDRFAEITALNGMRTRGR